jgi:hypothetical protein
LVRVIVASIDQIAAVPAEEDESHSSNLLRLRRLSKLIGAVSKSPLRAWTCNSLNSGVSDSQHTKIGIAADKPQGGVGSNLFYSPKQSGNFILVA